MQASTSGADNEAKGDRCTEDESKTHFRVCRFIIEAGLQVYEPYLVAMSAICLADKIEEQHLRTRDIISVCHSITQGDGQAYIVLKTCLKEVYLLHFLLSVRNLMDRRAWSRTPIAETALDVLKDSYHSIMCVRHKRQHITFTCPYRSLQTYGVELSRGELEWWQVCYADVTKDQIETIINELLQLCDVEAKCT